MASGPSRRELARLAVQKAKDHVAASKLLAADSHYDFATFHLLTAVEEIAKARLVGESYALLMKSLTGRSDEGIDKEIRKVLRRHPVKIPAGLLAIVVQIPFLEISKLLSEGRPISPTEVDAIKKKNLEDAKFISESFSDGFGIRNQSIYSGLDETGKIPPPFDWKSAVERLTPLLERQIQFSEWAVEQTMSAQEAEQIKRDLQRLAGKGT